MSFKSCDDSRDWVRMLPVQGFISTKEHLLPLHEVEVSPKEVGLFKHLVPILWRAHQETCRYIISYTCHPRFTTCWTKLPCKLLPAVFPLLHLRRSFEPVHIMDAHVRTGAMIAIWFLCCATALAQQRRGKECIKWRICDMSVWNSSVPKTRVSGIYVHYTLDIIVSTK